MARYLNIQKKTLIVCNFNETFLTVNASDVSQQRQDRTFRFRSQNDDIARWLVNISTIRYSCIGIEGIAYMEISMKYPPGALYNTCNTSIANTCTRRLLVNQRCEIRLLSRKRRCNRRQPKPCWLPREHCRLPFRMVRQRVRCRRYHSSAEESRKFRNQTYLEIRSR